jgi:hypothetical protein
MKTGVRVKVLKVHRESMPNLYNHPTDLTHLVGQEGVIERAYTDGTYGIEFDDDYAYMTRQYTGVLFREDELEII